MNRPLSTREELLEQVDQLQAELATAQRYVSDVNEAINDYRHREADLLNELATAKRDAERCRAALCNLLKTRYPDAEEPEGEA